MTATSYTINQQNELLKSLREHPEEGLTASQAAIALQRKGYLHVSEKNAGAKMARLCSEGYATRSPEKKAHPTHGRRVTVFLPTTKSGWPGRKAYKKDRMQKLSSGTPRVLHSSLPQTTVPSPSEVRLANETVNLMAVVLDIVNLSRRNKHFRHALMEALNAQES